MPEAPAPLDDAVGDLREVAAEGLAQALPAADAPAQRPIEPGHPGDQRLERHAGLAGPAVGQPHQVLGEAQASVFGQGPDPEHAVHRHRRRAVADHPLGQVDVADDPAVDLDEHPLLGLVRRVAQRAEERVAVGSLEDVQEGLVDRLVVGLGAEAELDRTATIGQPHDRLGQFHRWSHLRGEPRAVRARLAFAGGHPALPTIIPSL